MGVDGDPRATRNLGLFLLAVGSALSAAQLHGWHRHISAHPFKTAAGGSVGLTCVALGLLTEVAYGYLVRHQDAPIEFWRRLQARYRQTFFRIVYAVTALSIATFVAALLANRVALAGYSVGPGAFGGLLTVGNLTGGIRPM